jgi:hypothetical protein
MIFYVGNERGPRMRAAAIAFVFALALAPSLAFAQATPPAGPGGPPPGDQGAAPPGGPAGPAPSGPGGLPAGAPSGAISRDQFIELRAQAAGRLFDEIDTDHKGYITREQMRAYIRARRGGAGAPPLQR